MAAASAIRLRWLRFSALQPQLPPGKRLFAIGDIHGCLDIFGHLIEIIEADTLARGQSDGGIVILGDFIDRGPDSARLIELFRAIETEPLNLHIIKGNHEAAAVDALRGDADAMARWLAIGGDATLESFGLSAALLAGGDIAAISAAAVKAVPADVIDWLDALPLYYQSGDYLFVHAGIRPGVPLEAQAQHDLLWIRDDFLESRDNHGLMIVHGHSAMEKVQDRRNRVGIDTGAYWTGRLSALGIEAGSRWILST